MSVDGRLACGILLAGALLPMVAAGAESHTATRWTQSSSACWSDLLDRPAVFPIDKVPVGCETVDCCPGCPQARAVDWRVHVAGDAIKGVDLSFENLEVAASEKLQWTGSARRAADGSFRVGKGEAGIGDLPLVTQGRPPVATLKLVLDQAWQPKNGASDRIDIQLEQLLGAVVVNEFELRYDIGNCPAASIDDKVVLQHNASGDSAVILLRRAGASACNDIQTRRAISSVDVDNVMASSTCSSGVSVFSDDNAMAFVEHPGWTDALSDTVTIDLQPRLMAPVKIWLVDPGAAALANDSLGIANERYNSNNVGIGFNAVSTPENVSGDAAAIGPVDCVRSEAEWAQFESIHFEPGMLNVYYMNKNMTGVNCTGNRNVIYIGLGSDDTTLAHELGHALSLPHALGAMASGNIMKSNSSIREHLTAGQAFRMNVQCSSAINTNQVRDVTWPQRKCETVAGAACTATPGCPAVTADIDPK